MQKNECDKMRLKCGIGYGFWNPLSRKESLTI